MNYYNEFDPVAAEWIRQLIRDGLIPEGVVDTRSIVDVRPEELRPFTQCHFFAGIAGWSLALKLANWPTNRPIWTGSCPCQPFSSTGQRKGFDDERHLWPHFHWLIQNCRPTVVVGEQVASKDGLGWLDLVQADLEGTDYTSGAIDTCAAGYGTPHKRQRLYWLGIDDLVHTLGARLEGFARNDNTHNEPRWHAEKSDRPITETGFVGALEHAASDRWFERRPKSSGWSVTSRCSPSDMEHADVPGEYERSSGRKQSLCDERGQQIPIGSTGPTNGFWRDADWLYCRDGKWRAVEPGSFPLADGIPGRMGLLRGYGNAIVVPQAAAFIETVEEILIEKSILPRVVELL